MNNVTLAHIGGDLVLIGGVVFYFQKKTSKLAEEIETLKKDNKELNEMVDELTRGMQQLGTMFMQLQQQIKKSNTASPVVVQQPVQLTPLQTPLEPTPIFVKSKKAKQVKKSTVSMDSSESEETIDDKELDKELTTEYSRLEDERKKKTVECTEDKCKLVD